MKQAGTMTFEEEAKNTASRLRGWCRGIVAAAVIGAIVSLGHTPINIFLFCAFIVISVMGIITDELISQRLEKQLSETAHTEFDRLLQEIDRIQES